jgi:CubicO group peptidase (beta-lactamase class C family)
VVLDRFSEVAADRRLGIEGLQAVLDDGRWAERRWAADIRRDVFSVSKTVTSLAVGMIENDGLVSLDDAVLMHLPDLADTAAPGCKAMTIRHLLRMTAGNNFRWLDSEADHPGDPARTSLRRRSSPSRAPLTTTRAGTPTSSAASYRAGADLKHRRSWPIRPLPASRNRELQAAAMQDGRCR